MKRPSLIDTLASTVGCVLVLSVCAAGLTLQTKTTAHEGPDWKDKIIPGSEQTVLDLARRIIPDIKTDPARANEFTANDFSGIRLLDGVPETGMELDPDSGDESEITDPDYLWMTDGGHKFFVLLLKVDIEKIVIGLFQVSPEVSLLDAATIAQDVHVFVDPKELWAIHSQHQAFALQFWHDNSSESFDGYTFISIVDRKLRAVADPGIFGGFTSYSAAQQRVCKTATTPKFHFARSPGRGYFDLIVTELTLKACHRDSEQWSWKTGVVYQKSVRRLWRWNSSKKQYRKASATRR